MKKFLAALLFAVPVTSFAQVQSTAPTIISLDDAIAIAHQNSPTMRNSRNSVRSAGLSVTQAYARYLPSISTSASIRPAQNGSDANFQSGISASLNIFNYNQYFQIGQAKRQRDVAEANALQARYTVASQVKQQYYSALSAQEALNAARRQLEVVEAQMDLSRARVRTGTVVANDSINASISLMSAQTNLMSAENAAANSIRTFSRTLGIETVVMPNPADTANFRIIQLDSAALFAMIRDAPAALQSQAQIANAKHSLRTARFQYIPQIGGGISVSRSGSGQSFFGYDDRNYRYSGGQPSINFSFSLQVFNGFGREASLVNAREGLETAQLNFRDQQLNAENTLLNSLGSIRVLEKQLEIQGRQLGAAEENLRIVNIRYELDLVTFIEVVQAQNQVFTARNTLINSRNNYRNQIAQLEALVGRDLR
jgi:outer membrane protein TolC